jgi:hypothetical protein
LLPLCWQCILIHQSCSLHFGMNLIMKLFMSLMKSLPMVARTEVIRSNTPEDWSVKDWTSCTEKLYLGRKDDIVKIMQMEGAKCIITWGPTGPKGRPNPAGMGLGRSAQAGWPGPLQGSVRPLFPCTRRIFNPKVLEAPPFAGREPFAPRSHPQARERGGRYSEEDWPSRRKHSQVEKKEGTVGSVTMINGAMCSTLMG